MTLICTLNTNYLPCENRLRKDLNSLVSLLLVRMSEMIKEYIIIRNQLTLCSYVEEWGAMILTSDAAGNIVMWLSNQLYEFKEVKAL